MTAVAGSTVRSALVGTVDATFRLTAGHVRVEATTTPPLELRGPFHDDGAPAPAPRYFLRNVTAGVFGGDRYSVRVQAEAGVHVRVQPTSATRVHESRGAAARVSTYLEAAPGATLTFDAGTTILQQGSCLEQSTELVVHPGGHLRYLEVVALGRLASGERLRFHHFDATLRASEHRGPDLYCEAFHLEPGTAPDLLEAAVGGAGVIGTLIVLGDAPAVDPGLLSSDRAVLAGLSALHRGAGLIVRVLGVRVEAVSHLIENVLAELDTTRRPSRAASASSVPQ